MALWLNRSGRHGEHETKSIAESRIYLTWKDLNRDLTTIADRAALLPVLEEVYPTSGKRRMIHHAGQIWAFVNRMVPGDWVAMPSKNKTIHMGEITGRYTFDGDADNPYYHYRTVRWLETDVPRTNFSQDILLSLGAFMTICQISRNDAESRVRAMAAHGWKMSGSKLHKTAHDGTGEDVIDETVDTHLDLAQIARDHIAREIYSVYAGHGLEVFVEAILKAQGFTTYHSAKGPDGGIDLLAAPGTLGFGAPRMCVQVKSQTSPLERPVLDQLVGTMQHVGADQGLLVCWGGFKKTVLAEAPRLFFKVRLWDQNDLIEQFLAVYDKLDEDFRADIPLKRIWAIAAEGEGNTN